MTTSRRAREPTDRLINPLGPRRRRAVSYPMRNALICALSLAHHPAVVDAQIGRISRGPAARLCLRFVSTGPINRAAGTVPGVDDAGGGRRGRRAAVSAELWEVLAARWAISRQPGRDRGGAGTGGGGRERLDPSAVLLDVGLLDRSL